MVYDTTKPETINYETGESGYAIHNNPKFQELGDDHRYSLFTDDGRGNGDYICGSCDIYWIRRIAYSLDMIDKVEFDYTEIPSSDYLR